MKLIKYIPSFIINLIFIIVLLLAVTNVRADQFWFEDKDLITINEYDFSSLENLEDEWENEWWNKKNNIHSKNYLEKKFRECRRYDIFKNIFNIPVPYTPKRGFC